MDGVGLGEGERDDAQGSLFGGVAIGGRLTDNGLLFVPLPKDKALSTGRLASTGNG